MTNAPPYRTGPVGVGIIGAGVISREYLTNLLSFPDLVVWFVADLDPQRAAAQAASFAIPGSGSVGELLRHPQIEIVVNLTNPAAHVEIALQAVQAGKHVWSEKPFALNRESGQSLLKSAHELGLRVASAPDTFLGAGLQSAFRAITDGVIGTPHTALALMQSPGPDSWHPSPEFLFQAGAGPLFDVGPYYLTALLQIFGAVSRVNAAASIARPIRMIGSGERRGTAFPVTVPSHHAAVLEFVGGGSAVAIFSFESYLTRTGVLEISGSEGALSLPDPNKFDGDCVLYDAQDTEGRTLAAVGSTETRGIGVVELARAIRSGVRERAAGEQAFHVLDVMASITDAAARHESVAVSSAFTPPPPLPKSWDPRASTL